VLTRRMLSRILNGVCSKDESSHSYRTAFASISSLSRKKISGTICIQTKYKRNSKCGTN